MMPARQAHDRGPCAAPSCPRTAVRITPKAKLWVCDRHYGPAAPEPELRVKCLLCTDDALTPHVLCSNCLHAGHVALGWAS